MLLKNIHASVRAPAAVWKKKRPEKNINASFILGLAKELKFIAWIFTKQETWENRETRTKKKKTETHLSYQTGTD